MRTILTLRLIDCTKRVAIDLDWIAVIKIQWRDKYDIFEAEKSLFVHPHAESHILTIFTLNSRYPVVATLLQVAAINFITISYLCSACDTYESMITHALM